VKPQHRPVVDGRPQLLAETRWAIFNVFFAYAPGGSLAERHAEAYRPLNTLTDVREAERVRRQADLRSTSTIWTPSPSSPSSTGPG
jgi:hypothetical protein